MVNFRADSSSNSSLKVPFIFIGALPVAESMALLSRYRLFGIVAHCLPELGRPGMVNGAGVVGPWIDVGFVGHTVVDDYRMDAMPVAEGCSR
jgi:hypothetical protein